MKIGRFVEVEVELQDKQRALNNTKAYSKRERENNEIIETSNLLDKILSRQNMFEALKRVVSNKGSHGVDGMKIYELKEHLI